MTTPSIPNEAAAMVQAEPLAIGFSPMYLAPLDGTSVLLHLPTTDVKFAVGQWHGDAWGDDEGVYFTHEPTGWIGLHVLSRIAASPTPAPAVPAAEETPVNRAHLPDLKFIREVLRKSPQSNGDTIAAINGINYIIKRTEEAQAKAVQAQAGDAKGVMQQALEAMKEIAVMYAHTWDRADDGALLMMPSSIPRFEAAHEGIQKARAALESALAAAPAPQGEDGPPIIPNAAFGSIDREKAAELWETVNSIQWHDGVPVHVHYAFALLRRYGAPVSKAPQAEVRPSHYFDPTTNRAVAAEWLARHARECDRDLYTVPLYAAPLGESSPDDLRALGWSVAVHNDYRMHGTRCTFWLLTKDGRAIKGEGQTDAEALNAIRAALSTTNKDGHG